MRYFATRYSASSKVWELRKERVYGGDWTIFGWSGTNKTSWVRRHGMTCRAREREKEGKERATRDTVRRGKLGSAWTFAVSSNPTLINYQAWICAVQVALNQ